MPVAYATRKLKDCDRVYVTVEKECFAIVWAIQTFQKYLYGQEFILETLCLFEQGPQAFVNALGS